MAVTREQFESGMTYDAYKAQMTRSRDRLEANEKNIKIDAADLEAFKKLPKPLKVLVIAEDWCGDVIANLPIVGRLAQESGKLDVRVVLRDQSNLIDSYLNKGQFKSIPVVIFLDENFNELGAFFERPDSVTKLRADKRGEVYKSNAKFGDPSAPPDQLPEDVRTELNAALAKMRDETAPFYNKEATAWIRELATKGS